MIFPLIGNCFSSPSHHLFQVDRVGGGSIWKLDAALTLAESEGETDLEGVAAPILRGYLRSAPVAPQNRKHDPSLYSELTIKPSTPKDTTNSSKAA